MTPASDFTGIMIQLDGNLTLQNIIIDGGWDEASGTGVEAVYPIILENSTGDLTINAGTVLQNNNIVIPNPDPSDRFVGSGVQGTGSVTMTGGKICGNQIQLPADTPNQAEGAGIGIDSGTLTMTGGEVSGNTLTSYASYGAGICVSNTAFTMSGGTVSGNESSMSGGGICVFDGVFTMSGGMIGGSTAGEANKADNGGGLMNFGTTSMTGGSILGNKTGTTISCQGGGVMNQGSFSMSGSASVTGNTSPYGGGVSNTDDFSISGSVTIDGNTSTIAGGGVYSYMSALLEIEGGSINNNTSDLGAGVFVNNGTVDMTAGSITGNQATGSGGGIYSQSSDTMNISGGTVSGNSADFGGGGIYNQSSCTLNLSGGTISANTAFVGGGIVNSYIINMSGGTISGNTASTGAGVYHYAGIFNLSGGALIAQNNPVYLNTNRYITVKGALGNSPAAWVVPAAYPDFGGSVKVAQAGYAGATGATVLNALAAANSAYELQASGNDVSLVKLKINASITLGNASEAYTGSAIDYSGSVTKPADLNLADLVFEYKLQTADDSAYTTTAPTSAGAYSVKATLTGHVKYNDTASNVATFTINKATPVLSAFSNQQADYTGHDFAISAPAVTGIGGSDISGQGIISYQYKLQSASGWTSGLPKNAGVYDVKAAYGGNPNYAAGSVTKAVTIRKVALTATADNYTRSFGQPNPVLTITYSGFVNGEDASAITPPAISTTATAASNAGTYPITLSGGSAINYNITRVPGTLTVGVATPTITFEDQSAAYSGKTFAVNAPAITENGVDLSVYGTLTYAYRLQTASGWTDGLPTNAGVYDVRAAFTGNANITGGMAINAVTIRKAPLTAAANNITKVVGTENPALTIVYEGFVNHEDISALDTLPTASTTATAASDVGDHPITVSGGSAANYYFIYVPGTLTVSQLPGAQKPVFTKNLSGEYTFYNRVFSCNLKVAASVSDNGVITYQWYKNTERDTTGGNPISGATDDRYTVPANIRGTVYYYVVATNTLDANRTASAASSIVKVTVNPVSSTDDETDDSSPEATQSPSPAVSSPSPMPQKTQIPTPAPNSQGSIAVEVLPATTDTPAVTVSDSIELKDCVLTQEDETALQNGENITITLKVERVEGPVKQGDGDKVAGNMGGNTLGMYLNVELLKRIGEGQQQNILNTSKPIRIVLAVPPELLKDGRDYSVIRVHGDETTVLPDLDNDPATVTIETDRFSTYALVYQDGPVLALWMILLICILIVALVILLIYLVRRKKRGAATADIIL